MKDVVSLLEMIKSDEFLNWLGVWLGVFISFLVISMGYRFQISRKSFKDQLKYVYTPLFMILEPRLYVPTKDFDLEELKQIIEQCRKITNDHYALVNPSIIYSLKALNNLSTKKTVSHEVLTEFYFDLCKVVDKNFEKLRRKLHLPTRDIYYRLNNRQYKSKDTMFLVAIGLGIYWILKFVFFISLISTAIYLLKIRLS